MLRQGPQRAKGERAKGTIVACRIW
jgi:hypothetical protein